MIRRINTDENKANNRIRRNQTTERRSRRRENHVRTLKKELDENYVVRASVTVTSQEILYGYLVKVMRIASALDMTYSDFSARTTRDEIRPIIYGSESDIIIGEHKDQNRGYKSKDKDHMKSLYELYGAYGTRTRDSVHELTCAVNSRMKYVRRIMTMTRKKRIVTDLCMFVLVVYDEWESRFVNMRARTSARKVKNTDAKNMYRYASTCSCWCKHLKREDELIRDMGTSSCASIGGAIERAHTGVEEVGKEKKSKETKSIRRVLHENDTKGTSHVQDEIEKSMNRDE